MSELFFNFSFFYFLFSFFCFLVFLNLLINLFGGTWHIFLSESGFLFLTFFEKSI